MNQLTFENPVFACYALAAALMIVKMMSQGWITVFRMAKINAGFRNPEDAKKSIANPNPSQDQLLPNEYVERSRRMHSNEPGAGHRSVLYVRRLPSGPFLRFADASLA
jgi:glutathione S-transferase